MAAHRARTKPAAHDAATVRTAAPLTDALTLLKAQHADVRQLFDRYDHLCRVHADLDSRQSLIENLCALLTAQALVEDELLYPTARATVQDTQWLDAGAAERARERALLDELIDTPASDPLFSTKVHMLRSAIEERVATEEARLFPQLRATRIDLQAMATAMAARLEDVLEVRRG